MVGTPPKNLIAGDAAGSESAGDVAIWRRPYDWRAALPAAVICIMAISLLIVAARLDPDPTGVNTHTQLGIAPCGFLQRANIPCATCGMTTSFALAADGNLLGSFITQPAGAVFALLTSIVAIVSGYAVIAGLSLWPLAVVCWRPGTIIALGAVVIAAWGYKIITMHGV